MHDRGPRAKFSYHFWAAAVRIRMDSDLVMDVVFIFIFMTGTKKPPERAGPRLAEVSLSLSDCP
jgi:hypothetical protein